MTTHKDRLLKEGTKLFYAHGFHGTTVDALLEAAQVPKGSFYHHFGSKEAFAKAVVDVYSARTRAALAASTSHGTGLARLRSYFHALVTEFAARRSRVGCLVGKFSTELAPSSDFFAELLAASHETGRKAITEVIALGQEDGSIRNDLPASQLSHVVVSLVQGALTVSLAHRSERTLREVERSISVLLAGHPRDHHAKAHTKIATKST